MKKFASVLWLMLFLFLGRSAAHASSSLVTNGNVTVNLESGFQYYDTQMGVFWYDQAVKVTNSSSSKIQSFCRVDYSLYGANGFLLRHGNSTIQPTIAPNDFAYWTLFLYKDPSNPWSSVGLDTVSCTEHENDAYSGWGGPLKTGAPIGVQFGSDLDAGNGWLHSQVTLTNLTNQQLSALSNVAIYSPSYQIVSTTTLGTDTGCGVIDLAPNQQVSCFLTRRVETPFKQYSIKFTQQRYYPPQKSNSTSAGPKKLSIFCQKGSSISTVTGIRPVCPKGYVKKFNF
jgi:hypothetical protein